MNVGDRVRIISPGCKYPLSSGLSFGDICTVSYIHEINSYFDRWVQLDKQHLVLYDCLEVIDSTDSLEDKEAIVSLPEQLDFFNKLVCWPDDPYKKEKPFIVSKSIMKLLMGQYYKPTRPSIPVVNCTCRIISNSPDFDTLHDVSCARYLLLKENQK